jgi:ADP-heptose:LPS heptosyltransferase
MLKLIKKKSKTPISLKNYHERRNKILIKRRAGGFGDILMQRMMFEDFSKIFPGIELTFSCPFQYIEMAKNHPFVNVISLDSINEDEYGAVYDITTACRVHEARYGSRNPYHRSDIWAAHCGIILQNHNMHLKSNEEMKQRCKEILNYYNPDKKPTVILATKSTNDDFGMNKSLTENQIEELAASLKNQGYFVYTIHKEHQTIYENLGINQFVSIDLQAWIAFVDISDYIISIDSATFHIAGGLKKPLVGIFTFTDGKVYGKYYDFILVQKHRDNGNWPCGPCFNIGFCPKTKDFFKPCLTELTSSDILKGFAEATTRWIVAKNDQKNQQSIFFDHKA